MRFFITFFLFLFISTVCIAAPVLRDYDEFDIPQGYYIPVISLHEFSSAYCEEGDKVSFKTTNDIFLYDKKVIPEGTRLEGYIDKKNEPVIGTHAAIRVFVNKMYLPDGYEVPIKSYVYTANNNMIGGGLTAPAEYTKKPHYARWTMFRAMSVNQYVPGAKRQMGEHVTVSAGANLMLILTEPLHLTHTVLPE